MKSGFVSIIGLPNVGKSTILNKIIGEKISIVTEKSQTTRNSIYGIYNDDESQIVFIDTPGIHKPFNKLGEAMDKISYKTIRDCDLALYVIDASRKFSENDNFLFEKIKFDCPVILVFNKIDLTNVILINELKEKYLSKFSDAPIVEMSAIEGFGIPDLIDNIKKILPEGPKYYDETILTTSDLKFRVEEIIREQILKLFSEEIPHGVLIVCENINFKNNKCLLDCKIIVEKESQKGIVIGKQGKKIKQIGINSRKEIESLLKKHVNLDLVVRVEENWRNSNKFLNRIGYKL